MVGCVKSDASMEVAFLPGVLNVKVKIGWSLRFCPTGRLIQSAWAGRVTPMQPLATVEI